MLNTTARQNTTPRTVLVVEDEPTLATAIAQRITAEGWTARVAGDGASAVQAASQLRPDLVIMDIMLPVMDGLEATKRIVTVNGEQVHLTPTEFDLLATLARRPKSVLTREKLLEEVWDWVDASGTRTVDSHVKALRHKLGADTIRTVHGVGYAFEPPTA